jgi:hypothetical protein
VEAKKLGIRLDDMVASISAHWKRLRAGNGPATEPVRGGHGKR